ncbi:MAG: MgtC/SapB family protein [Proteobacteria bacterium]|nr:MgtC/SapB family protein [Pseudomonadota bacterium]
MSFDNQLSRVALALGMGLLIGLERGWSTREAQSGSRAAGVRTFAICGLLGGLLGALASAPSHALTLEGGVFLGIAFLAFAAVITLFGLEENKATGRYSATTTIAALLTFVLGAYAAIGDVRIAAAAAVAAAALLIFRQGLHEWVKRITRLEFESALLLLAMTFIALPVVPPGPIGPFGGVNPREVWIIAIALASVSFVGYVAVKVLGEHRGILIAAAAGGLVSSTAVAFDNAKRSASDQGSPRVLAAGTSLATAVSFVRVAAITGVLNPSLALLVAPALLAGVVLNVGFALVSVYGRARSPGEPAAQFRNPFSFWSVLGMAATMGLLILGGRAINTWYGSTGAIAGAAAMGIVDVDAMTVSMARLMPELGARTGTYALLAGVASNLLAKVVISALFGRRRLALRLALPALGSLIAGWLALLMTVAGLAP